MRGNHLCHEIGELVAFKRDMLICINVLISQQVKGLLHDQPCMPAFLYLHVEGQEMNTEVHK